MNLSDKSTVLEILKKHNLFAKKSFGQNFLVNKNVLDKIVETANISKNDYVIEIGPGLGVLTQELCKSAKKVTAIELDKNIIPILEDNLKETKKEYQNLEIKNEDALKFIPPKTPYKIVANIPYNITSHLISHFLQSENKPISLTLLVQKEVAQKVVTQEPDMSVLSLGIGVFAKTKIIKKVSASNFFPQPKVDSAILQIEIFATSSPNYIPEDKAKKILSLAKIAFSQKRKKLKNTIGRKFSQENFPVDLSRRPETLSVEEWKNIIKHTPNPFSSQ